MIDQQAERPGPDVLAPNELQPLKPLRVGQANAGRDFARHAIPFRTGRMAWFRSGLQPIVESIGLA
jgi:hypothetical protein